jgi:hypothetical protein
MESNRTGKVDDKDARGTTCEKTGGTTLATQLELRHGVKDNKESHRAQANVVEVGSGRVSKGGEVFQLVRRPGFVISILQDVSKEPGKDMQREGIFTDYTPFPFLPSIQ